MKLIKRKIITATIALLICGSAIADAQSLGGISAQIYGNFAKLSKLITAGSYIAGLGFALASIMKFKMHKDNPTQVPIGTPAALTFIAAAMLFLPSILGTSGATIFNDGGTVATSTGTAWEPSFEGAAAST